MHSVSNASIDRFSSKEIVCPPLLYRFPPIWYRNISKPPKDVGIAISMLLLCSTPMMEYRSSQVLGAVMPSSLKISAR